MNEPTTEVIDQDGNPVQCQWFALCDRPATTIIQHPAFEHGVPACERCEARARG